MRLEAKTACVFLCQIITPDIRKDPGCTDAQWESILLMVTLSLIRTRTRTTSLRRFGGQADNWRRVGDGEETRGGEETRRMLLKLRAAVEKFDPVQVR